MEVVPPYPPKLVDMARTVLEYDEDLPPIELDFVPIDLRELATGSDHYLFPCRCAGLDLEARVDFLDAGPPESADWTLVGCERSRQIHAALYGHDPHSGSTSARCCTTRRAPSSRCSSAACASGASSARMRG